MFFYLASVLLLSVVNDSNTIDLGLARRNFAEAEELTRSDGGRLWGMELNGPMLFVDPLSRDLVANQPDAEERFTETFGMFAGKLPPGIPFANTSLDLYGVRWAMMVWPLPNDPSTRSSLMIRELYRLKQEKLSFPRSDAENAHLSTTIGRTWLRLELRALERSLLATKVSTCKHSAFDALIFRARRHVYFVEAAEQERSAEIDEGLAEYTSFRLQDMLERDLRRSAALSVSRYEPRWNFDKSFARASGLAYCLLLDRLAPEWRENLSASSDLALLALHAIGSGLPKDIVGCSAERAHLYHLEDLHETEAKRLARFEEIRRKFLQGKTIRLALSDTATLNLDAQGTDKLDKDCSFHRTIQVRDAWGVAEVSKGAVVKRSQGWPSLLILAPPNSIPKGRRIEADAWTLELADGWRLEAEDSGYTLRHDH